MGFIPAKVCVLPAPVFVCAHIGAWVRRLQGLCDPEMSPGVSGDPHRQDRDPFML